MTSKVTAYGNGWSVRVRVRDARTGRVKQKRITAPTKGALRVKVTAAQAASDARTLTDPGRLTVADYLTKQWLPDVAHTSKRRRPLAPTTEARYRDTLTRHVIPGIGDVKLRDLNDSHVTRLRNQLLASGKLGPQSVGDCLRLLSQGLRHAHLRGLIPKNYADPALVPRPDADPEPFVVIGRDLAARILAAVRGEDPWDVSAHLALGCGLRREECLGLRWPDVDLGAGTVAVRHALTFAAGELHDGDTKSKAGERTLHLAGPVLDALKRHRAAQDRRRLALGVDWQPPKDGRGELIHLIVDRGDGGFFMPPSFSTGWRRFASTKGLRGPTRYGVEKPVTFHTLRHGHATLMLAGGVPDSVAVKLMGHSSVAILRRRYQEVVDDLLRDAADRVGAMLGGG